MLGSLISVQIIKHIQQTSPRITIERLLYSLEAEHAADDLGIKHAPLIVTDRFPRVIISYLDTPFRVTYRT